eukprot:CAMPEP_0204400340 /NCGR_PEP_ID=MMETSP0470-20130426/4040_1 /ASSEMBLY_ACC=CAM_ASM_000385 /TAXON_ID=2969 /ORGANISM="Oxyrrhis marina" /LENGTH=31 /DNA_ID= /DNA_START= /DNA_END= /DNA_ORIENTATION=
MDADTGSGVYSGPTLDGNNLVVQVQARADPG